MPNAPDITASVAGDTQVTLTIDADDAADVVYIRYRTGVGGWAAESETFKRTGDGDVTVTGLTNDSAYEFVAVAKSGSDYSFVSDPEFVTPTDGTNDPTSYSALTLYYGRCTVAGSGTFQALVGVGNQAAALPYVHGVVDDDLTLPTAVLEWDEGAPTRTAVAGGSRNWYDQTGGMLLHIYTVITASTELEAMNEHINTADKIVEEMCELSGLAGYLNFQSISVAESPARPGEDEFRTSNLSNVYRTVYAINFYGGDGA